MSLILIHPAPDALWADARLEWVLRHALAGLEVRTLRRAEELDALRNQTLLFAVPLGELGINLEYIRMLARLRREPSLLEGCTAGLIVDGAGELYTKSAATELALAVNAAGCALLGRPLVEGTGSLANFAVQAHNLGTDLAELLGKKNLSRGIHILVEEESVTVDLGILVKYGYTIPDVARAVQEAVAGSIEATSGLTVAAVNVNVGGVVFEKEPKKAP